MQARLLLVAFTALLAACGGGGGGGGGGGSSDASGAAGTVAGTASKGPLGGATVRVFQVSADGTIGGQIGADVLTDPSGAYSLNLSGYSGTVLIEVRGGVYADEADSQQVALSGTLRTLATVGAAATAAMVTPLTEMAVANAIAAGGLTRTNIDQAVAAVQAAFGVADILRTTPAAVLTPDSVQASSAARIYGLVLAGVSQYAANASAADAAGSRSIAGAIKALGDRVRAGNADASRASFRRALDDFIGSPRNRTGWNTADASASGLYDRFNAVRATICGSATPFVAAPVPLANISHLRPLGTFSPGDHIYPTPHMYFMVKTTSNPNDIESPVIAPANATVFRITLRKYASLGGKTNYVSHTIAARVCDELEFYLIHVRTFTNTALAQAAAGSCSLIAVNSNESVCNIEVNIPITGGQQIGTTGDSVAGVGGLDVGVRYYGLAQGRSAYARPERWCGASGKDVFSRCYAVCSLDLLANATRDSYLALFSDPNRQFFRTEEPRCGDVYLDVPGSLQGHWVFPGTQPVGNESPQLFLGPATLSSNYQVVSTGTKIPGLNAAIYLFAPRSSGRVNRRFNEILEAETYCIEKFGISEQDLKSTGGSTATFTLLVRLAPGGTSLAIERRAAAACGDGPWSLGASAASFER